MWLLPIFAVLLGYILYKTGVTIIAIAGNYRVARKTGLPIVVCPVSPRNPIWLLTQKYVAPIINQAPFGIGSWTRFTKRGWLWKDHEKMQQEMGKVWVQVSPRGLDVSGSVSIHHNPRCGDVGLVGQRVSLANSERRQVFTTDLEMISQVYKKNKDFDRSPQAMSNIPNLIRGSVSSVTGSDWQRHRRITAPPFNEHNMTLVWSESLRQAAQVCEWWARNQQGFNTSCVDTMTVALNVLATAGLGQSWRFSPTSQRDGPRQTSEISSKDFRDTMATLLSNMTILSLTSDWLYDLDLKYVAMLPLPKAWIDHLIAAKHFRLLMRQMVDERRSEFRDGKVKDNIFLNAMIAQSEASTIEKGMGLSDLELFGNMFTYGVAGHETTAHTLNYTLHLLSAYPQWQDWIQEEVDAVYQEIPGDLAEICYSDYYPQLKRCIAMMVITSPPVIRVNAIGYSLTDSDTARGSSTFPTRPGS